AGGKQGKGGLVHRDGPRRWGRRQCWPREVNTPCKRQRPLCFRSKKRTAGFPAVPVLFRCAEARGFRDGSDFVGGVFSRVLRLVGHVGGVLGHVGSSLGGVGGGVGHFVRSSGRSVGSGVGGAISGAGGGVGGSLGGFFELAVGGVRLGLGLGSSVGSVSGRVGGGVLVRARGQGETHGQCQQSLVNGHCLIPRR